MAASTQNQLDMQLKEALKCGCSLLSAWLDLPADPLDILSSSYLYLFRKLQPEWQSQYTALQPTLKAILDKRDNNSAASLAALLQLMYVNLEQARQDMELVHVTAAQTLAAGLQNPNPYSNIPTTNPTENPNKHAALAPYNNSSLNPTLPTATQPQQISPSTTPPSDTDGAAATDPLYVPLSITTTAAELLEQPPSTASIRQVQRDVQRDNRGAFVGQDTGRVAAGAAERQQGAPAGPARGPSAGAVVAGGVQPEGMGRKVRNPITFQPAELTRPQRGPPGPLDRPLDDLVKRAKTGVPEPVRMAPAGAPDRPLDEVVRATNNNKKGKKGVTAVTVHAAATEPAHAAGTQPSNTLPHAKDKHDQPKKDGTDRRTDTKARRENDAGVSNAQEPTKGSKKGAGTDSKGQAKQNQQQQQQQQGGSKKRARLPPAQTKPQETTETATDRADGAKAEVQQADRDGTVAPDLDRQTDGQPAAADTKSSAELKPRKHQPVAWTNPAPTGGVVLGAAAAKAGPPGGRKRAAGPTGGPHWSPGPHKRSRTPETVPRVATAAVQKGSSHANMRGGMADGKGYEAFEAQSPPHARAEPKHAPPKQRVRGRNGGKAPQQHHGGSPHHHAGPYVPRGPPPLLAGPVGMFVGEGGAWHAPVNLPSCFVALDRGETRLPSPFMHSAAREPHRHHSP